MILKLILECGSTHELLPAKVLSRTVFVRTSLKFFARILKSEGGSQIAKMRFLLVRGRTLKTKVLGSNVRKTTFLESILIAPQSETPIPVIKFARSFTPQFSGINGRGVISIARLISDTFFSLIALKGEIARPARKFERRSLTALVC